MQLSSPPPPPPPKNHIASAYQTHRRRGSDWSAGVPPAGPPDPERPWLRAALIEQLLVFFHLWLISSHPAAGRLNDIDPERKVNIVVEGRNVPPPSSFICPW